MSLSVGDAGKMLCPACRGTGRMVVRGARRYRAGRRIDIFLCEDCGGMGFAHCCDGLQEQPDVSDCGIIDSKARSE